MGRWLGSLAVFVAIASLILTAGPASHARQGSLLPSYAGLKAEMASLRAEAAALVIEPYYCPPPKPPSKREHEALVESMQKRGEALQRRFETMQTGMQQQATSPIYGPMYSAAGADPSNPQYFQAGRRAMEAAMAEIARKQAQLDRTATRPCNDDARPPAPDPVVAATGPLTADEEAAFADFPLAVPTFAEVAVPVPPRFCSFAERNAWTKDVFWPAAELAKQNALKAIDTHTRAEARLRDVTANDRDGSPRIDMARRSVEAWRVEKDRRMAVQQRILNIDVPNPVDCSGTPEKPVIVGPPVMETAPDGSTYFRRPILSTTFLPELPPCFRDEADRQAYMRDKYFPTVERSLANGQKGADYLWKLGETLKGILRDHGSNSAQYKAADAEFRDYEAVQAQHKRFHDELTGPFHARIAALPICNLEKPTEVGVVPGVGGKVVLPPPALGRPTFERVPDLKVPLKFCSEFERNAFLTEVYNPAVASALANARAAQEHQARLNAMFTEHMRANSEHWAAVRAERDAYEPIANAATAEAERLRQLYAAIMAVPLIPCGADSRPPPVRIGEDPTPVRCPPKETGALPCPRPGRDPIQVGSNGQVGSGAQLKKKLGGMAMGALAGALGGGGGGGGGGSGGPDLWTCRIKDSEMTVFDDPASGVSLKVGAKRDGKGIVIFSEIAKSPDKGTFQTAFLERPDTAQVMGPRDVGPCDLWGEWKLTVSWTKDTYVDGRLVDHQEGGWSEGGKFSVPGVLSKTQAPDGLWRRMGFSGASNGARKMAAIFDLAPGGGPMTFVIHVTRPRGDPVTTVPFVLTMTEGPGGFVFTKAPPEDCPEPRIAGGPGGDALAPPAANPPTEVRPAPAEPAPTPSTATPPPASGGERKFYHPPPQTPPSPNLPDQKGAVRYLNVSSLERANALVQLLQDRAIEQGKALETARCEGPGAWETWRSKRLERLKDDIKTLQDIAPIGRDKDAIQSILNDQIVRMTEAVLDIEAMQPPEAATTCPLDGEFRSILDSMEDERIVPS